MPDCSVKPGEVVVVGSNARTSDCTLEQGAKLRFLLPKPPEPAPVPVQETPPAPPLPAAKGAPMPAPMNVTPTPAPEQPAPAPLVPAADPPPVVAAHTEQPAAAPSPADITAAMQSGGGGIWGILGALIVVAGGAAGWKFWNKLSEQKHEQAMEDKRIAAQEKGLGSAQPIPCQTVAKTQAELIAALRSELDEMKARFAKVEKKSMSMSADFDADELSELVEKHDKEIKTLKKAVRAAGGE